MYPSKIIENNNEKSIVFNGGKLTQYGMTGYSYSADGKRIRKTIIYDADDSNNRRIHTYKYNGNILCCEKIQVFSSNNSSNTYVFLL